MQTRRTHSGFTTIELIIAIASIALLAVASTFIFNHLRERATLSALFSDLSGASTQLKHYKERNGEYPTHDTTMNNGNGVMMSPDTTYSYTRVTPSAYCLTGYRTDRPAAYHITEKISNPIAGPCQGHYAMASIIQMQSVAVGTFAGSSHGYADGSGTLSRFALNKGYTLGVGTNGNLLIADTDNNRIRRVTPSGAASTLAGSGTCGSADGTDTAASFCYPLSSAADRTGNVYVTSDHAIRKIARSHIVTTLAGSQRGHANGSGTAAQFDTPQGIVADGNGTLYVTEASGYIRKITPNGTVSTLAGNGTSGYADGQGTIAIFNNPTGITVDGAGNVYVVDTGNNRIRKISSTGAVSTIAGSGQSAFADGSGATAAFAQPHGITCDPAGNLYVTDTGNYRIRKISPDGTVTTLAGNSQRSSIDGPGNVAGFDEPYAIIGAPSGTLYILDSNRDRIRSITF